MPRPLREAISGTDNGRQIMCNGKNLSHTRREQNRRRRHAKHVPIWVTMFSRGEFHPPDNRNAIHPKEGPFFSGPDGCSATLWWACVCQSVRTSPVLIDVLFRVAYPSYICMYLLFVFPAWLLGNYKHGYHIHFLFFLLISACHVLGPKHLNWFFIQILSVFSLDGYEQEQTERIKSEQIFRWKKNAWLTSWFPYVKVTEEAEWEIGREHPLQVLSHDE